MINKIIPRKKIHKLIEDLRSKKKNIVTYNGSFDVLHVGHLESISEAKQQGDVLIILLNSDKSIKMYKGPLRPIISEKERAEMISVLQDVDYIVIFDEINPKKILSIIKPDVHCNGSDWGKNCVERDVVEKNGGRIHVLKWKAGYSTTDIVSKIFDISKKPNIKAIFMDRDGTINDNKEGYIHKIEDFEFLPGVLPSLKKLSKTEYHLIIVTNQSGVGRGKFSHNDFQKLSNWMVDALKKEKIKIDKIYHCPHHPEDNCGCRKPGIGLFLHAVEDFGINLSKSWLIGDNEKDVLTGREANIKTIKIGDRMNQNLKLEPNYYASNFQEAADIILSKE